MEIKELQAYLKMLMDNAKTAARELEKCSQEQVDAMTKAIAKAVYDHAEELARDAVDETKMGVYADKVAKNKNKAKLIWWSLKDKLSVGIIDRDVTSGIIKIAKPVGVVAAITPLTNPIVTPMSNAMFAIKGRNSIIITAHHKATRCGMKTIQYINAELEKLGAPKHAVQIMEHSDRELTRMLVASADKVIATGGMSMVKTVYSSGKPALGVGAGNVQCLVDTGVNYEAAVKMIIKGRAFDNGIICTGEQSVIAPSKDYDRIMKLFDENGAYVVRKEEVDQLRETIFPDGKMERDLIGQGADKIAKAAGLSIMEGTKILVVEAADREDILGSEKMFPVLSAYRYDTWDEAIEIARDNLEKIGKGHSICIHSYNKGKVEEAALKCEVSRIVVNQSCSSSGGGSFQNGLNPTNTLGCGTWGNNSISENLTYYHLLNISRIANVLEDRCAPDDAIIWG